MAQLRGCAAPGGSSAPATAFDPGEQPAGEDGGPLADAPEEEQQEGCGVGGEVAVDPTDPLLPHGDGAVVDRQEHMPGATDGDVVAGTEAARGVLVDEGARVEPGEEREGEPHQRQPGMGGRDRPARVLRTGDVVPVDQQLAEDVAGQRDARHRDALDEPGRQGVTAQRGRIGEEGDGARVDAVRQGRRVSISILLHEFLGERAECADVV